MVQIPSRAKRDGKGPWSPSHRAKRVAKKVLMNLQSRAEREDKGVLVNLPPRAEREAKEVLVNLRPRAKREGKGSQSTYDLERSEKLERYW